MTRVWNHERLRAAWDALRTSFWFVPSLMIAAGGGLASAAAWGDRWLSRNRDVELLFIYQSPPENARDLISTLLGAMITMTSLVFSITMVVLTLAASQFGPRLIRNFMASLQTQIVLGTFVMTVIYCLLIFISMGSRNAGEPAYFISVSFAALLVVVSVALLVFFHHGLARSIMAETVIQRVGSELMALIDELEPLGKLDEEDPEEALPEKFDQKAAHCGPGESGYVQSIEFIEITAAAKEADIIVGFHFRPGDFVIGNGSGIAIHPGDKSTENLRCQIAGAVSVGSHRTPVQDIGFSIRHLVEVAVRALSPSLNDPYTAIAVIDQLSACLAVLFNRSLPRGVFRDADGAIRVICPRPTHESMLNTAFDQIRQNGMDHPVLVIHLFEAIERLAPHAPLPSQRQALALQADMILAAAKQETRAAPDISTIEQRAAAAKAALAEKRG